MRSMFILVMAALVTGCAGREFFYQTPRMTPDSYEVGTVVSVELVAPGNFVYYDCQYSNIGYGYGNCLRSPKISPRARDAIPLRGPDGLVDMYEGGSLLSPASDVSNLPDETIDAEAARGSGWSIHSTIRLDSGEEITVVDSVDKGLLIGDQVNVGFKNSPSGRLLGQVSLFGPNEDMPDLVRSDGELIRERVPTGPWGRINAQLQQELSLAERRPAGWPVPANMLDQDLQQLTDQELAVLTASGSRLLGAMEVEYVDFTQGLRSEEDLRGPIEVIFETNLGFGIREAWEDYEEHAILEFATWLESNYLVD